MMAEIAHAWNSPLRVRFLPVPCSARCGEASGLRPITTARKIENTKGKKQLFPRPGSSSLTRRASEDVTSLARRVSVRCCLARVGQPSPLLFHLFVFSFFRVFVI